MFIIGDNDGANTDTLELKAPEQLAAGSDVTVNSTGLLRKTTSASAATQDEVQNLVISGNSGSFQVRFAGSQTAALPFNVTPSGRFFQAGNETQQITNQNGNPNGGFQITFKNSTSTFIPSIASAQQVQDALEAMTDVHGVPVIGPNNVLVDGPDGGPYVVTFIGALTNENLPLMTVQNVDSSGKPNFQVQAIQDGGISGSPTASLENALNSLPSKPANLTFSVTGTPGNYVITMVDSNAIKTDQPPLEVVAVGGATATVTTLVDGGSNGGYDDTESIRSLNMVIGGDSSAQVEIGAGATLSLGANVNLTARPGLPTSAPAPQSAARARSRCSHQQRRTVRRAVFHWPMVRMHKIWSSAQT